MTKDHAPNAVRGRATKTIAIGLLLALTSCRGGEAAPEAPNAVEQVSNHVEVRIKTASGQVHAFTSEIVVSDIAQQQGLSGRKTLGADAGMLFPFPYPKMASFWMKDTLIPLDLLFIRADGTIAEILHGEPHSLQPIAANEPVTAVLEINRGRAAALDIAAGNQIEWGDCTGAPAPVDVWQADRLCPMIVQ